MSALAEVLQRIRHRASARAVLVVDGDGDLVAGDADGDQPSATLRQLWVNRLGGAEGLSRQIDAPEFAILVHDVSGDDVHISTLDEERVLCVVFDKSRTSLGLVRLRLKEDHNALMLALGEASDDD